MRQRHLAHLLAKPGRGESIGCSHESFRSTGNPMRLIGGTGSSREVRLPPGYVLDHSDPDVLVLRCPHGKAVARFSAWGVTDQAIEREARTHYREQNRSA
jgi:hypothetical protein